jgi:hypothetical protein
VATFGGSLGLDGAGDRWVPGARGLIASSKIHPFLDVPDQAVVSQRRKTPSFHPLLSHKEGSGAERGGTRLDLWRSGGSLAGLASDGDSLLVACARCSWLVLVFSANCFRVSKEAGHGLAHAARRTPQRQRSSESIDMRKSVTVKNLQTNGTIPCNLIAMCDWLALHIDTKPMVPCISDGTSTTTWNVTVRQGGVRHGTTKYTSTWPSIFLENGMLNRGKWRHAELQNPVAISAHLHAGPTFVLGRFTPVHCSVVGYISRRPRAQHLSKSLK